MPILFSRQISFEDYEGSSTAPYVNTSTLIKIGTKYLGEGLVPSASGDILAVDSVETLTFASAASGGSYKYASSEQRGLLPNVFLHTGMGGARAGYRLGEVRQVYNLSFSRLNSYLYGRLSAWCRYRVYGSSQPFSFTNSDGNVYTVRWTAGYDFEINSGAEWSYSHDLTLEVEI